MGEYTFLAELGAIAVATIVFSVFLRRHLGPKIPVVGKAGLHLAAPLANDGSNEDSDNGDKNSTAVSSNGYNKPQD